MLSQNDRPQQIQLFDDRSMSFHRLWMNEIWRVNERNVLQLNQLEN